MPSQLVAYSGFSATNYGQEPYSADLDFGTGEFSVGGWVSAPVVLPVGSFPKGTELVDTANTVAEWTAYGTNTISQDGVYVKTVVADHAYGASTPLQASKGLASDLSTAKQYAIAFTTYSTQSSGASVTINNTTPSGINQIINTTPTTYTVLVGLSYYVPLLAFNGVGVGQSVWIGNISVKEITGLAIIADRSAASGPSIKLGMDTTGKLSATAFDGTTTRTVATTATYNTGVFTKAVANYTVDGKLAINVNGVEVASATGTPLLTMSNTAAVLTIGNSRTLDAPFSGSITMLKLGATVPTTEQSVWMYEQEKQMFRSGAQVTLPDSTAVLDLGYDEAQDKWVAVQAGYESSFTGLIRTASAVVSAGSLSKVVVGSGIKALARTTSSPGVDIQIPAYGLREELVKRAEAAAKQSKTLTVFDFDAIAAQTDFVLPVGWKTSGVISAGNTQREGATKNYTRLFDGFRETVRFAVAPGTAVWVRINAIKE